MSHRPLVFVSGLTLADYLLWSWSSGGDHAVLGLVSGLTLPPLAAACAFHLVLTLAGIVARGLRRPAARARPARPAGAPQRRPAGAATTVRSSAPGEALGSGASSDSASRTLAA